jgi:hypothetical protein
MTARAPMCAHTTGNGDIMLFAQGSASEGLTLERVLQDIPHDAGAFIIYALAAAFIAFIWYGNRQQAGGRTREDEVDDAEPR